MTAITTAFIPVSDAMAATAWYSKRLGLEVVEATPFSAVLEGSSGSRVTLMGATSGIGAKPGLDWATCNFLVEDLTDARDRLRADGSEPTEIVGEPDRCLYFTMRDPDGNLLLVTDR